MKDIYVVGIAGGSASGKSSVCSELSNEIEGVDVKEIYMDKYFKPREERPKAKAPITGIVYVDDNHPETADLAKLNEDVKSLLHSGFKGVIIIEGLLTLWDDELYDMLDLKLFVECRADERIVRRLRRNMSWGLSFDEISDVYLDLVRYRHDEYVEPTKWRADFILNGSAFPDKAVEILARHIEKELIV